MPNQRGVISGGIALACLVLAAVAAAQAGLVPMPWADEHERATVTICDDGTELAVVDAEVADTQRERYVGLSDHEDLAAGEGMLFVHDDEDQRTYVMREMDFGIDIVFIDADRRITEIHSARAPEPGEDGESMRYSGTGKYVLEVPKGYMEANNASVGDRIVIEYER